MTSPLDFLYSKQDTTSATKPTIPKGDSSLNFLYEAPTQEPQQPSTSGFANYISNVAKNWTTIGAENTVVNLLDPIKRQELFIDPNAGNDLVHVFDHIFSAIGSGDPISISTNTAIALGQKQKSEGVSAGGLATGLIKPIVDLGDLTSEINLESPDAHALTPEEKTERLKSTAGLIVTSAIAGPVAGGLGATGNIFAKAAANTAIGGILGGVYGGIASANDPNQVASIITNGIMGGKIGALTTGIGVASGMLFGRRSVTPQEVQQVRQVQLENNTIPQAVEIGKNLMNADDLADALLQGKIGLKPNDIHVIPGISFAKIGELTGNVPEGYRSALHVDGDGVGRLLVYDDKLPIDEKFYEKNGFLKNQIVSYLGKEDWKVTDASGKMLKLENTIDGNKIDAHVNDVRLPANISIASKSVELTNRLYDEWKSEQVAPNAEVAQANNEKYGLIGFDETPPENFVDKNLDVEGIQTKPSIETFLTKKNFDPEQIKNLSREFQIKLGEESYANLSPEDQALIAKAREQNRASFKSAKARIKDFKSLDRIARSNGYRVSEAGSGRWIIRAAKDGRILTGAENYDKAVEWINKSGQDTGPKLDDNVHVDTDVATGGIGNLPPSDPPTYPQDLPWDSLFPKLKTTNRFEDIFKLMDHLPIVTRYRNFAINIDRLHDTKIFPILDNLFNLRNQSRAAARPYAERVFGIQKTSRINSADSELAGQYLETMTPHEVITGFMNRPMNPTEIRLAQRIAASGADLENVFLYQRQIKKLDGQFPIEARNANPEIALKYQQQAETAKAAYGIDDKHLEVAKILDAIEEHPKNEISQGAVVRLARAMNNGVNTTELSRAEFAKLHGMTPGQISAALASEKLNGDLARVWGISPDRQLGGYMTHARIFFDGDIPKATKHFSGDLKTKEFYAKQSRTGEISAYETNMLRAQLRYIKTGFDVHSGFSDALANARPQLEEELLKLPPKLQKQVRHVMDQAFSDVQGMPAAADLAAQENLNSFMDRVGLTKDGEVRNIWTKPIVSILNAGTSGLMSTFNIGALGFRAFLGASHFGISTSMSILGRDVGYTNRMLANGARALVDRIHGDGHIMDELHQKGVFTGLSPFSVMNPDIDPNLLSSKLGAVIDKVQETAFKATLLPTVYDGMAAGHYLTTYQDAIEALTKFKKGEITGTEVNKRLYLERFDAPVAQQFKDLAKTNTEDAAHFLGRQAVEDLVGTYGQGNTPYLWGSNFGRLLGQFGNYSMWVRGSLQRIMSRGSWKARWGAAAKLAAIWGVTHEASELTGIDVTRMNPFHAMFWLGGPSASIASDVVDYFRSSGYAQEQAKQRLYRLLPINPRTGNLQPSLFIPGSYAIDGLIQASEQFSQGNAAAGALQVLGFRKFNAAKALEQGF